MFTGRLLLAALAVFFLAGCITPPGPTATPTPAKTPVFCGGIAGIPCPEGYRCVLEGNYPDAGGRCESLLEFTPCEPGSSGQACIALYDPVCAKVEVFNAATGRTAIEWRTFSNGCVACSSSTRTEVTLGYWEGAC